MSECSAVLLWRKDDTTLHNEEGRPEQSVDGRASWWESRTGHRREGRAMAYSIRCADAGMDCPGSFTTETKEELMKHVELHANEAHPDIDLQPEQIETLVQSSA